MPILVNGETIDESVIRQEAAALRPRMAEAMTDLDPIAFEIRVKEWARENVIERTLLRQAALADPEPIAPEALEATLTQVREQTPGQTGCVLPTQEDELRREVETQMRVERLVERITSKAAPPRNKDVVEYYKKHREEYLTPEAIHASHIVKNVDENTSEEAALAAIHEAQEELRQGVAFTELADRLSDCPGRGGDLGWFPRGQMVEEFEEVVFALSPGQVSEPFRSPFGYHLAQLHERKPAGPRPLEEVRDGIEETLHAEKRQRLIEQFLDHLRAKADISTPAKV